MQFELKNFSVYFLLNSTKYKIQSIHYKTKDLLRARAKQNDWFTDYTKDQGTSCISEGKMHTLYKQHLYIFLKK